MNMRGNEKINSRYEREHRKCFFAAPTTQGDNGSSLNTLENFLGCNQVSGKGMVEMFPTRAIKTSDRGNFEFTIFMPCYHRGTRLTMLPTDTFPMSIEHDGSQARVKHGDRNGQYIYGLGISIRPDGHRRRAAPHHCQIRVRGLIADLQPQLTGPVCLPTPIMSESCFLHGQLGISKGLYSGLPPSRRPRACLPVRGPPQNIFYAYTTLRYDHT